MTGTAQTEAGEFSEIYNLQLLAYPQILRLNELTMMMRLPNLQRAGQLVSTLITDCQSRGQPILVGTVTIEKSEALRSVEKEKIKHQVLNARFHEEEAKIIALAGVPGALTIATNMAGRGTDIQLGGNLICALRKKQQMVRVSLTQRNHLKLHLKLKH